LCQTLAGIAALTSTLAKRLATGSDPAGSATAAEIAQLLRESIGQVRDLARGLGPIGLKAASLDEALETLALNFERMFHVSCTLECDGPFVGLPYDVKANLYRIAQEAAHNAVAHGRADKIEICLSWTDGKGSLTVRDNGVGIPEAACNAGGIGLHTMAYRARLIGASLEVRRRTRRGTVVTCNFPLPGAPDIRDKPDHERSNA
jgi:signal transduction histidine kinase